ncbi:MAG: NAD(P)/FAD-dependent oxidoreductase [Bacteroidales bacterium]|nr:NAD(P)/FAD-dependent oxidoreductase [Bacteroidales bacterium]
MKRINVIGAGAAGCFCAIQLKRRLPDAEVVIYEAGPEPLMKVAVTGGGRCNLTNSFADVNRLAEAYPRGEQVVKRAFRRFSNSDTMAWFEGEGVKLVTQEDNCVFPKSQDAMQIVHTLEEAMRKAGVRVVCNSKIGSVRSFLDEGEVAVVTVGGSARRILEALLPADIELVDSVPSLFTLKIQDEGLKALMGTVVEDVALSLEGTNFKSRGALLLTDWGVSGPATLKLSSYAARHLAQNGYKGMLHINWLGCPEEDVRRMMDEFVSSEGKKMIQNAWPEALTNRLWEHILERAGIRRDLRWAELGGKGRNRLASVLLSGCYEITGRATFKEEFVTCGGVALSEVDLNTLECKKHPGLYFAGEVLDIDAITGGFNLQAAWSTAYAVAEAIAEKQAYL